MMMGFFDSGLIRTTAPVNGYVAEDGTTYYVSESGLAYYTQES